MYKDAGKIQSIVINGFRANLLFGIAFCKPINFKDANR